ncbi:MAG: PTS sugar transporter subunit IIA [Burkholderiaceae bacterium]
MNSFSKFLYPENIFLDLHSSDKMNAFAQIAEKLERQHQIRRSLIFDGLNQREQLGSTGLGKGVAIPHAQIEGLRHPIAAFVRFDSPISFDAPDEMPVLEMFIFLVPHNATIEHLQMLADVIEMLCDDQFRMHLKKGRGLRTVQQLFENWPDAIE